MCSIECVADSSLDITQHTLASVYQSCTTPPPTFAAVLFSTCILYHRHLQYRCLIQQFSAWRLFDWTTPSTLISDCAHHGSRNSLDIALRTASRSALETYQLASTGCEASSFHLLGGIFAQRHRSARTGLLCVCFSGYSATVRVGCCSG